MKVKLKTANYIKFGNPWNIKVGNKVLIKHKNDTFPAIPIRKPWLGKIVINNITLNDFKIKEDKEILYWHKSRIAYNYSNYKFKVL